MSREKPDIRLLMVDDEREFLQAVEPGLVRRGFEVTLAENGAKALDLLASRSFDVVVLDVKMPGLDGVDVFREIKRRSPELPVVMLTGHGNIQQAFETSREGVQEYLTKPCDVETLAQVLQEAVERTAAQERAAVAAGEEVQLLLVDDDLEFVRSITPSLERRGMVVSAVHDGQQALERIQDRSFEVAVVDVVMPGMDGLTLLDRLHEEDPLLEVVILTGNPRVGDVRRSLMGGAFDYLMKPCKVEELARAVRSAHERRKERVEEARRGSLDEVLRRRPD
jgi:DNA-binding NtrC family response regulator